jgi:hypothetical protein
MSLNNVLHHEDFFVCISYLTHHQGISLSIFKTKLSATECIKYHWSVKGGCCQPYDKQIIIRKTGTQYPFAIWSKDTRPLENTAHKFGRRIRG